MTNRLDNTMIKIDGARVRRLREEKGLTQLYVATIVGVTTDTVSRWENRRYQTIKRQNGVKLAEALEVELDEILDRAEDYEVPDMPDQQPSPPEKEAPVRGGRRPLALPVLATLLFAVAVAAWLMIRPPQPASQVTARRSIPDHTAPGSVFPVRIEVTGTAAGPLSLIIKEELPASATPIAGIPPFKTDDKGVIRWLRKTTTPVTFLYLARIAADTPTGTSLAFSGSITQKGHRSMVIGDQQQRLEILPYHWADSNRDGQIDDDEILSVYDTFSDFEERGIDFDLIEEIWASAGYRWDPEKRTFVVLP